MVLQYLHVGTCNNSFFSFKVSLDGILQDIRSLERGMEISKKEFLVQDDSSVLKDFIKGNSEQLGTLAKDSKTAQVSLQTYINSKLWQTHISCLCYDLCSGGV